MNLQSFELQRWARLAYLTALAVLPVALWQGCGQPQAASAGGTRAEEEPPRVVRAIAAESRPVERTITVTGSLAALEQATVSVKAPGRLREMAVDMGSVVAKGQLIARIDPTDYELKLQQAEAQLAQARARLGLPVGGDSDAVTPEETSVVREAKAVLDESARKRDRVKMLFEQEILSQSEIEAAEAAHEVALNRYQDALEEVRNRQALLAQRRAEVAIARQQLADTAVLAPFDGVVQERRANAGEYLSAGAPLVSLVSAGDLRLRLEVPERQAFLVRPGQAVRLSVEGDPQVYTGEVKRLSPILNESNRMLLVEADVPNRGSLRPGYFVRAEILVNPNDKAVMVPRAAVTAFAGLEKIFVVENGKAVERSVATARKTGDWVEITKGLKAGERVVLEPGNLSAGEPVQPEEIQSAKP